MSDKPTPGETFRALLKARYTLLWIVSDEERRAERSLRDLAEKEGYRVIYWDCAEGAHDAAEGTAIELSGPAQNPGSAYAGIRARTTRQREITVTNTVDGEEVEETIQTCRELWILRDLHDWLNPVNARGLKSLARNLQDVQDPFQCAAVVVLSASRDIPLTLQGVTTLVDWKLPNRREIGRILDDVLRATRLTVGGERDQVIDAAAGLPAEDIAGAFALSIIRRGRVDPGEVSTQKKLIIDKEKTLQWSDPDPRGMDALGGLDLLKEWLEELKLTLTPEAREFGLPAPRGVLIAGVPGTGKSTAAKAVAAAWGLPLLYLDLGACRGSLVGQSEAAIRGALKIAEAVAPTILWIDEIEKGLAGASSRGDGGVAADALSTLLTWMQEHQGSVFVVATANQVRELPPELTRRGRFDDAFFIDLPTTFEREAIAAVSLRKYGRDPAGFQLVKIAQASEGFTGAEIESAVKTGLLRAFREDARELTTGDVLTAAKTIVPMSRSSREAIDELRAWAEGRARRASTPETKQVAAPADSGYGRALDLGDGTEPEEEEPC